MTPDKMRQLARDLLFLANFRTQEGNYADAGRLRSDAYMLRHKADAAEHEINVLVHSSGKD